MPVPVDVLGELSVTSEDGVELRVEGRGDTISMNLPNLGAGRALARHALGLSEGQGAMSKLQAGLRRTDLTIQVNVAGRAVAYLSADSEATMLSKLLGLGAMEVKPMALLAAALRPRGRLS